MDSQNATKVCFPRKHCCVNGARDIRMLHILYLNSMSIFECRTASYCSFCENHIFEDSWQQPILLLAIEIYSSDCIVLFFISTNPDWPRVKCVIFSKLHVLSDKIICFSKTTLTPWSKLSNPHIFLTQREAHSSDIMRWYMTVISPRAKLILASGIIAFTFAADGKQAGIHSSFHLGSCILYLPALYAFLLILYYIALHFPKWHPCLSVRCFYKNESLWITLLNQLLLLSYVATADSGQKGSQHCQANSIRIASEIF